MTEFMFNPKAGIQRFKWILIGIQMDMSQNYAGFHMFFHIKHIVVMGVHPSLTLRTSFYPQWPIQSSSIYVYKLYNISYVVPIYCWIFLHSWAKNKTQPQFDGYIPATSPRIVMSGFSTPLVSGCFGTQPSWIPLGCWSRKPLDVGIHTLFFTRPNRQCRLRW